MTKNKIHYRCTNCDYLSFKWIGCCPTCNEWNSFIEEEKKVFEGKNNFSGKSHSNLLCNLKQIKSEEKTRIISGIQEWDRVIGNGILPGSFLILTGDPGIGKSTILLQIASKISIKYNVLYFASEESLQQVKSRANRLGIQNNTNLLFSDQACLQDIIATAKEIKPNLLILDSIQNCHLSNDSHTIPGTIAQLREAGFYLMKLAKENNIAICITCHITKDGGIAGPKILEHMVDGVFYLQGEDKWHTRILRSLKNRFGTIYESGFFEMGENGLTPVLNINEYLLSDFSATPGSAIISSLEGSRPILLELQALCVTSKFGIPQRVITGIDPKRVMLIAAILEKYLHIKFSSQDIFFKVSGGFKIKESSCDLGIALALLSSYFQKPITNKSISFAEISLTGQIKPINQISIRIKEAEKFGIKNVFISKSQKIKTTYNFFKFSNVYELLKLFPES
ncbi:DNA repair protein RadA [Candidatus Dependentiae bacterium]|nr:DNA repair protein RadA [Candidatus Dependentiae bacterium]